MILISCIFKVRASFTSLKIQHIQELSELMTHKVLLLKNQLFALNGFLRNFLVEAFSDICRENSSFINPLNAELNPICYLLALLAHYFLHVNRIRVKSLTLRLLMPHIYIYIYIYDISSLRVNQLLYCVSSKISNKLANYFCELKFSGNTHQRR